MKLEKAMDMKEEAGEKIKPIYIYMRKADNEAHCHQDRRERQG